MSKKISDYKTLLSKMIETRNNLEKELNKLEKELGGAPKCLKDVGYAFMLGQYSILKNTIDICRLTKPKK